MEIVLLSLPSTPSEQYGCSQVLRVVTIPPCYTRRACLCVDVPTQIGDVDQRPEILMGAAIFLCFSSDDELQANSKERGSGSTVSSVVCPVLPVVKPLSVACDG